MRCATRGRFVDSGSRFNAPALLPGHGPATRRPLPSPGFSRLEFPGFTGTMERSDSRPSLTSHFVAFARRLPPPEPVVIEAETVGRPKFLENPHFRLPCSIDAGRTANTRPLQCRSVAPGI